MTTTDRNDLVTTDDLDDDDELTNIQLEIGARLRKAREDKGLSLKAVEDQSGGEFPAVVLGSWERGDRKISVPRLLTLARWYELPVAAFLPSAEIERLDPMDLVQARHAAMKLVRLLTPRESTEGEPW